MSSKEVNSQSTQFTWTVSRHFAFNHCPRNYYYRYYRQHLEKDDRINIAILSRLVSEKQWIGQRIHSSLASALSVARLGKLNHQKFLKELGSTLKADFESSFKREYLKDKNKPGLISHHYGYPQIKLREVRSEAKRLLESAINSDKFKNLSGLSPSHLLAVEQLVNTLFEGTAIKLKFDVAITEERSSSVHVIDWKTGAKSENKFQIDVYRVLAKDIWKSDNVKSEAFYFQGGEIDTSNRPEDEIRNAIRQSIAQLQSKLVDKETNVPALIDQFPQNISTNCMNCSYQAYCFPNQAFVGLYPWARREPVFPELQTTKTTDAEKLRQKDYVKQADGPLFVLAGPGTGKTEAAAAKVSFLLKDKGVNPQDIICLTYTNAAVDEIQTRLKKEGIEFDQQPRACTLHSFLFSVSESIFPYQPSPDDFARSADKDLMAPGSIVKQDIMGLLGISSTVYDERLDCLNQVRQAGEGNYELAFAQAFDKVLTAYRAVDWGHVAYFAYDSIKRDPSTFQKAGQNHSYLIGDEFQDFSPVEQDLIEAMSIQNVGGRFIFADDDQTIYASRHCRPARLQNWIDIFGKERVFYLTRSSRCHENVAVAALRLISKNQERISKPDIEPTHIGTGTVRLKKCFGSSIERQHIVACVRALTAKPSWWYEKDFGILITPKNRAIAKSISKELSKAGIDHELAIRGDDPAFVLLRACLMASVDFDNGISVRQTVFALANNGSKKSLPKFFNQIVKSALENKTTFSKEILNSRITIAEVDSALKQIEEWNLLTNFADLVSSVISRIKINPIDSTIRFQTLVKVLSTYPGTPSPEELIKAIDKAECDADSGQKRIRVCTTYGAKGLGAQFVFIPGFEDPFWFPRKGEDFETIRRLLYVGLTRAREGVYLTWAPTRGSTEEKNAGRGTSPSQSFRGVDIPVSRFYSEIGFTNSELDQIPSSPTVTAGHV